MIDDYEVRTKKSEIIWVEGKNIVYIFGMITIVIMY